MVTRSQTKKTVSRKAREYFSQLGYLVGTVEHWDHHTKRHHDLFGCDMIAFGPLGCLMIQVTTGDNHAARKKKLLGMRSTGEIMSAGCHVIVASWRLSPEKRGSGKMVWKPRIETLYREDLFNETQGSETSAK